MEYIGYSLCVSVHQDTTLIRTYRMSLYKGQVAPQAGRAYLIFLNM